ncbi:NifU family protein [Candidatus Bathyarchaeota archaeon]|nr:NifU family protein [Candidatus Bathyarchaeota archaeon]
MEQQIETALDKVRQALRVDGGDIELKGYNDGIVEVKLKGHCAGCMHAQATLKNLVEKSLKEMIGEDKIKSVRNVV